jgi:hypothetical protein
VGEIGRLHVCRWVTAVSTSTGGSWRPARLPPLAGSLVATWDDVLPPLSEGIWRDNLDRLDAALEE